MPDILRMLSQAEQLDFSQNFLIPRPNYIGDTIFPDRKTQNFKAEYLRLAAGSQLPTMALVHGLDTEAHIGSRPALERVIGPPRTKLCRITGLGSEPPTIPKTAKPKPQVDGLRFFKKKGYG